jgi:16S rRNA (cytosine967-C5)-methyltransferase
VLRHQTALDRRLAPLVPRGWETVDPRLQDVLRLGAYQLAALDRVPSHAAVDTSVALAKARGGTRAGGFVNAVLRKFAALPDKVLGAATVPSDARAGARADAPGDVLGDGSDGAPAEPAAELAATYSHPPWLIARWLELYGAADTERLLRWNNGRPRLVLQPARLDLEGLGELWRAAGIKVTPAPYGAGLVVDRTRPEELPGYDEGDFVVQDPAQALLAWYADLPPGAVVYDACAAPGGKTVTMTAGARCVVAADKNAGRVRRLAENLRRAGSGREYAVVADARHPPIRAGGAGAVLLDVPCLGTGTFARHPDARWRVTPEALGQLEHLQAELLGAAADAVTPGGLLVYSTCSLEPEENERQIDRFLERHPEFRREPNDTFPAALQSAAGDMVVLPQRHGMDGAFAARLRRAEVPSR